MIMWAFRGRLEADGVGLMGRNSMLVRILVTEDLFILI
jgi:hypothetical protein